MGLQTCGECIPQTLYHLSIHLRMSNSLQFIEDEIGRQRKSGTTKVWQPASCHHSIDIQHAGRVDIAAVCCTCMGDASFLSVVKGMGTSEMVVT